MNPNEAPALVYFEKHEIEDESVSGRKMDMEQLQRMLGSMGGRGGGPAADTSLPDTSEKIQISSLSLLAK